MKSIYSRFKELDREKKIIYVFIATMFATMIGWIIQQFIRVVILDYRFFNGTTWSPVEQDYWMDFFNVNYWTQKDFNPYTTYFRSSYPPLILAISRVISFMTDYSGGSVAGRDSIMGTLSYHLVFCGCMAISLASWLKCMREKGLSFKTRLCIGIALICAAPNLYLYGRGNYLIIVVACISVFIAWYNSEKRWQRELSLIILAIAAGIKLYPALLASILLKERRFADFFKTVVYTIAAFFLPFLVFSGGFSNISVFLTNLMSFQGSGQVSDSNYSVPTFLYYLVQFTKGFQGGAVPQWVITVGAKLSTIMLLAALFLSLFSKNSWKALALVTIGLIVYPAPSYVYTATMLLPVIVLFLICDNKTKIDYVYMALFLMVLIPVQLGYVIAPGHFGTGISFNNFMQLIAMMAIYCLIAYDSTVNLIHICKDKLNSRKNKKMLSA